MELKKDVALSIAFLSLVLVVSSTILTAYFKFSGETKYVNLANPLNLSIKNAYFSERNTYIVLHNPNNFSIDFYISLVGIRNSLGSACPITIGGDIGNILSLRPNETTIITISIPLGCDKVYLPFEKGVANLTITLYYRGIGNFENVEGRVFVTISKS